MRHHPCRRAAPLLAALLLAACGGQDDGPGPTAADATAAAPVRTALFEADGQPSASAHLPPPGWTHRTQAGLYATAEQVAWEALTVEPYTVVVDVDALGGPEVALAKVLADHRWSPDGDLAAFYVRAADARLAVAVADALSGAGLPRVFLVVGERSRAGPA